MKRYKAGVSVLGVFLVLLVCGIGSYLIVLDERKGVQAQANNNGPQPTAVPVDISSRTIDPKPLTVIEVFPTKTINIDPSKPTEVYTVLKTQPLTDCRPATSGDITKLLSQFKCTQVVRGTMLSPTKKYLVTGGIINLDTVESAVKAYEGVKPVVDAGKGRFLGYAPDSKEKNSKTKPLATASTQAGWNIKGHYLAYCVIARADGKPLVAKDPFMQQILYDVVEFYLKGKILEDRATDPVGGSPAPQVSGTSPTR